MMQKPSKLPRPLRASSPRGAIRHDVVFACNVVRERDGEGIAGVAMDFSTGGLQALTRSQVLTGEPVCLTFRTPVTGRWLSVKGVVTRIIHGRRPNEWGRRLGIEFEDLSASDLERVKEASERMDVLPFWA